MNTKKKDIFVCFRLLKQRKLLKKTQIYVADICGVSTKTVGRWETDTPIPSDKLSLLFSEGFDVTYIITGSVKMPQSYLSGKTFLSDSNSIKHENNTENRSHLTHPQKASSHGLTIDESTSYLKWAQENQVGLLDPTLNNQVGSATTIDIELFAAIPLYNGSEVDNEEVIDSLVFKKEWIHNELHSNPAHLYLIHVEGDSMEPNLRPGDVILVDHSDSMARRDGIYVITMDGALLVKRLQRLPDGVIKISSDNPVYEPYEFSAGWDINNRLKIIGRVVWSSRRQ